MDSKAVSESDWFEEFYLQVSKVSYIKNIKNFSKMRCTEIFNHQAHQRQEGGMEEAKESGTREAAWEEFCR